MDNPIVAIIVGRGTSGSTLLGHLLSQHNEAINVGELDQFRNFHKSMDLDKRICSDGIRLENHPFWKSVRTHLKNGGYDEFINLKEKNKEVLIGNYKAIIKAIHLKSNKNLVIISIKKWHRAQLLASKLPFKTIMIHLIRDPRAYGYSCVKKNKTVGPYVNEYKKVLAWDYQNLSIALNSFFASHLYLRITYENLVTCPQKEIDKILNILRLEKEGFELNKTNPQPVFSGNSNFMNSDKKLKIRLDYINKLSSFQWFSFTFLSFPSNFVFGYLFTRRIPNNWVK